jgi:glycosyltransferase involved in cell wall biosynthesis
MVIGIDASRAFMKERSGVGEYARELLEALVNKEHLLASHKIILFVKPGQDIKYFSKKIPLNWSFCTIRFFPIFWNQGGLFLKTLFLKLDLLFVPSNSLPLLFNKKTIYVLHGLEMEEAPQCYPLFSRFINNWLSKKSLIKADKVLTFSRTTAQKAVKLYGIDSQKIKIIYQGFRKIKKKYFLKPEFELIFKNILENPYLIYVGNLDKRKNIKGIIEAFNLIKRENKNLGLVLLGKRGFGYSSIRKKIESSKWKNDIWETGYLSKTEKMFLISRSCCLVCVSFAEGFGRTVLEALSLNVPVVISKIGVFLELYKNQGYFVNQNNPLKIKAGIAKVLEAKNNNSLIKNDSKLPDAYNWDKISTQVAKEIISFDKN